MHSLFYPLKENHHKLHTKLFGQDVFIGYSFIEKDEELYIDEVSYQSKSESIVVNGYLNLLINRGLEVIDRITVKELDYFLRADPRTPYFSKISQELLEVIEIGEKIKTKHLKSKVTNNKVYNESIHGPFEFMSLGERIELFEDVIAHPELKNFELECTNIDGHAVYLESKGELSLEDKSFIVDKMKELSLEFLRINI